MIKSFFLKIFLPLSVVIIVIYVFFQIMPSENIERCKWQKMFNAAKINGVVINKYLDHSQHSTPLIEITGINTDSQKIEKVDFFGDNSNAYNLINKFDTLFKPIGTDTIFIKKNGLLKMLVKTDFGCTAKSN